MRSLQITAAVGAIGVAGYSLLTPAPWTQVYARTCTQPIYYNSAASFTFDVTYTNVSPSGSEMTAFEARTDTAADGWTWEFENRQSQSGIDVSRVGSGGDWQVIIDGNEAADAANIYYGNHTIVLGSNYIDGTYDATRVAADMLHEFGHVLGFDDLGSCTDSIMCNLPWVGPDWFTACDYSEMFEPNWGEYWVDNDSDGYNGWDGIGDDCNDDDWSINPGYNVWVSCDYVNAGDDNNCSGVDDIYECQPSPIIIDVVGDGFRLTDASNGVVFDLPGQGAPGQLPWTAVGSDDAWLALDRNGNGRIDNGLEMFGNFTEQPPSNERNGFRALAIFDEPANGGNGDRWIDSHDSVYAQLQLWVDRNHDGVSQASELENLPATHLRRISLDYRDLRRVDRFGNWFRYGARVLDDRNRDIGPMAYDVFLGSAPPPLPGPRGAGRER